MQSHLLAQVGNKVLRSLEYQVSLTQFSSPDFSLTDVKQVCESPLRTLRYLKKSNQYFCSENIFTTQGTAGLTSLYSLP